MEMEFKIENEKEDWQWWISTVPCHM